MSEDLRSAVQMLAADNARLCDRLLTAEAVIEALRMYLTGVAGGGSLRYFEAKKLTALLAAHDAGRPS